MIKCGERERERKRERERERERSKREGKIFIAVNISNHKME
jgi:hypothetical protein